jgi:hypothetical protein
MQVGSLWSAAVEGLHRQMDAMDGAAQQVLVASSAPSTPDRVDISAAGKRAAGGDDALTSGIEGAMVDMRVSKYLAVANLKTLQTGDDMTKALTDMVQPDRG